MRPGRPRNHKPQEAKGTVGRAVQGYLAAREKCIVVVFAEK